MTENSSNLACSLEELRQIYGSYDGYHHFGITINLPRRKQWSRMLYQKQQEFIYELFKKAISATPKEFLTRYQTVFELSQDLTPHLHGIIHVKTPDVTKTQALIFMGDFYKTLFAQVIKVKMWKCLKWECDNWYPQFLRVKTPLLTMQYMKDEKEYDRWITYLHKQQ